MTNVLTNGDRFLLIGRLHKLYSDPRHAAIELTELTQMDCAAYRTILGDFVMILS